MKSRPNRITRLVSRRRRFALHPLSFAICLGLSGAALALPQGGTVVTGTATITTPTPTTQVIRQTTDRAIIDWRSFSIAAGERVRFYQPSSTSVTLNRVTGYDPSFILGQMSSNGRVFLVNPYGVVFGAGARVDVGGLVVSTLSIANNDFMAGRYSLTSVDADAPASRGAIRNEGTINAPGGTVVLAGPVVSNTGTITANGGRVGLVAANSVSVDVEGDGLLFFQANATEARNRLEQLGRIQADGGTVEMRAAARGAFADTVLNMGGVVQARSLGNHEGRVVIDGGNDGVVAVSGAIDATGTGRREQGGAVTVLGERILLADGARIDVSGRDGGGTVRVGGDFHGANPDLHNAASVDVQSGVEIRADALRRGDGGTVAIWADGSTRYRGSISARGGERGGDGGFVEVSGRQTLDYDGLVDTRAPKGVTGTLLLDPTDISIEGSGSDTTGGAGGTVTGGGASPSTIKASTIESLLGSTNVVVDTAAVDNGAPGTITVNANVTWTATTSLTLQAASTLTISPGVQISSTVGDLNLQATGNVLLNGSLSLGTGSLLVSNFAGATTLNTGAASFTSGAAGTITTAGGNVNIRTLGDINLGAAVVTSGAGGASPTAAGGVTLRTVDGSISSGVITANGGAGTSRAGGAAGGNGGAISITAGGTARTINTGVISATGGQASANLTASGVGTVGGTGGTVTIANNSTGNTTLASITTTGGAGGAGGAGTSNGGAGGVAGGITASANAGTLAVSMLSATGGAGGAHGTTGGADGAAGANAAINLNFGQVSAGTLDLTGATIQGGTATAAGGAGSDTILVADGAQNVVLTSALLTRPAQGNVVLVSVENAGITTGTGTLDASAFTGTVAVQYTSSAGTITGNGGNTTLTGLAAGSTFAVTTANAGTIDGTTFSGVGSLVGGTAADSFTVSGTGSLTGSINGGTGAANSLAVTTTAANFGLLTASSGTASNVTGGYTNITSLTGNGTDSTLTGTNAASAYTIDSAGGGNVNGSTTFSGIASLVGGSNADGFSLSGTGSLAGSIDGGAGANSLTLTTAAANFGLTSATAGSASNVTGGYSNIATLAGNGTTSTLTGSVNASVFTVTGNNAGTASDVSGTANFSGIANLAGGAAADSFVLGAGFALASIDGGGGTNSLTATANPGGNLTLTDALLTRTGGGGNVFLTGIGTASLAGETGANTIVASGFGGAVSIQLTSGADSITGNGANTTLIAAAGGGTTTITALNAGNSVVGGTTTNFTGVGNLMGGAGVDTFVIDTSVATALSGNVTGVSGNDVLNLTGRGGAITITQSGTVSGDTGIGGTLSGINTFGGNGASTTFQGNDANQTYLITGTNAFSVGGQNLVNVGSILAGNLDDVFVFQASSSLAGSINGNGGSNTLNIAAINGNVTLSSATGGNATGIGGTYSNIGTLVGNGTTSSLTGTLTPSAFLVSGGNSGTVTGGGTTTFSGMGSLNGGVGADTFTIGAGGSLSGSIDGGSGAANALNTSALGTANFVLSSASSGVATGVGGNFINITTLTGNGTTSTLTGTNAATAFAITGVDTGTVTATGTTNFSGIASLVGGNLADSFTFTTPTSQLNGGINGGAGSNTLDLSALGTANFTLTTSFSTGTATNVGTGYSNIATLIGNGTSVLTGRGTDSAYAVTGANSGTVTDISGTTTFSGVASLTGGAGADSFALTGGGTLTGNIVGGLGANSLSLSAATADFVLNTPSSGVASGIGGTYSGVTTLAGNNTNSTLTGTNADSTWTVSSTNTGTLNVGAATVNFSGIRNLVGGSGNDDFVLAAGVGLGLIGGGTGSNTLTATANGGENITLLDGSLDRTGSGAPVGLSGIGAATLIGGSGNNTITGSGWSGTVSLQISAGTDVLTGNGIKTTLVADPAGGTITLTGPAAGQGNTSSGTTFSNVGNLRGNTGIDIFAIDGTGSLAGNLAGVGGNDTLDLTGKVGVVTINQGGSIVGSGIGGSITGISTVIGNGAGTSFVGTNTGQTYTISGGDQFSVGGQTVNNVGTIVAGTGNDSFVFASGGHLGGSIDGGAGTNTLNVAAINGNVTLLTSTSGNATGIDNPYTNIGTLIGNGTTSTLTGANVANAFAVTGVNAGTVTAVGTTNFSGMASLVGGNLADSFTFTTPTSQLTGSIDGGAGINTLSLSGLATANFTLTTNFSTGNATNVGGNYSNITTLVGNNSSSTLTGRNASSTYAVTGANSGSLNDGVGTVNFSGVASLVGGSSPDVFNVSGSLSGSINGGTGGTNTLNLSALSTADFGLNSASSGSASSVGLGYSNVTTLIGNGTSSTLTGTATGSTYNVSGGNSGTVNDTFGTTTFSGIASLAGGVGADLFTIGGSLTGSINGGAGAGVNTLNLSGLPTANFVLTNASSGTASGVGVGGYSSVTNLVGNGTSSTLTGSNNASTYSVTGNNTGTVTDVSGTTSFTGVPRLVGGTATDSFVLSAGVALGSIDGGSGAANSLNDTATVSENLTLANGQLARSTSGTVTLANIGSATLTGGTGNNTIDASGWTGGRTLVVNATTGADTVVGNGVGTTLLGMNAVSTFNLTGADSGTLTTGVNTTNFSAVGNLTGGSLADTFVIQNAGTLSGNLNGGGGQDTLDLSNKSTATLVFSSAGTDVSGAGIAGSTISIETFIGNVANTTLQGQATGQTFVITGDNEITVDGTQVFQGVGSLSAGTGVDNISGGALFHLAGSIFDAGGATNLSGTIRTDGSQTYLGAITAPSVTLTALGGLTAVNAGNDFGAVSLTGGSINLRDTNAIDLLSVTVGAGQTLSIQSGGTITLNGNVATTANQSYTGNLLLATDAALSAGPGTIAVTGSVDGGTHNLALTSTNASAAAISVGGTVGNVGTFAANGNARIGGNVTSTGTQTYTGTLALANDAVLDAGTGKVDLQQAVDGGGHNLTVTSGNAAADAVHVGGTVSNTAQFTANGSSTIGANVATTGNQLYNGNVTLANNVTLDSGAATLRVQGNVNGGAHNLNLASSAAAANAIAVTGTVGNVGSFNALGNATLGGNVTSTGNQTYSGTVALSGDATLNAGGGKVDLQQAVNAAGHAFGLTSSNVAADAIHAEAAINNASQLTVTGRSTLATGVTTTGAQTYTDTVTLSSSSDFAGSSLGFGNGIVAGAFDLGLRTDALNLAGTVSGSGNATLSTLTQGATIGIAGGAGTLQLSQATLDRFAGFSSLTIGRADGTGDLTFGNLVLPTQLAVVSGSGDATFTGTVASAASQGRDLTVTTGGTTTFAGAVGGPIGGNAALGNLTVAGATQLDADLTANGNVSLTGPVTIGADATLSTGGLAFGSSVDVGNHAVTLFTDGLTVAGAASGTGSGSIRIATRTTAGTIGIAGGAGTLQLSQGLIDTFAAVPTLALGRSDGSGAITVGNLVLPTDLAITSGTGNVAFTGTVDSAAGPARDLTVNTAGVTSFAGTLGATRALDQVNVSGASQIGASITSTGAQTYTGAATLTGDSTLSASSVTFGSTVDGARALTVNAGNTSFGAAVGGTTALTSLTTDAAGTTQLNGNVTTSGAQTYNDALQLNSNTVLTGSTLTLAGTVDGAHTLAVNGSTAVTLGGAIGSGTTLTGLSVTGPLTLSAGNVTTTGTQSYAGATTLGANTTLNGSSIAFGSSIDGGFGLTLQSAGTSSITGAVGANTALASFTAAGGGAVQIGGAGVTTTGAQSYSGALQLSGASTLTGSSLTLNGNVTGATDLTLRTDALVGGTSITGSGVLTIASIDPTLSIGVAGGAGALQVSQALLSNANGFTSHVIGRADGTGSITTGDLQLHANTTLQTNTGDITLGGTVDGAFGLTLNSGGTTRITAPIGATTQLASLVTDNNAAAADWNGTTGERTVFETASGTVRISTAGAQTYNDPVTSTAPVAFIGSAITATQTANRFDGTITATATSLDLRNSVDLLLGALTLANGGTLETDGILHIGGAVDLRGGVLVLRSNATPTPIDLTDPEYAGRTLTFGFVPVKEASATIVQDAGGSIHTEAGSTLVLRSPEGGSILLEGAGNTLLGGISAVSGTLGDNSTTRFNNASEITLGFIRIASSEIHVAGAPPASGDQTLTQAGLEGDVIKLTADILTTGPDGLIRARLPFNNIQGASSSLPGLTLVMSPTALLNGGGFGGADSSSYIQVQVGGTEGGFITARPHDVSGNTAVIFLGGSDQVRPFYDGAGRLTEIRIFYNGNAPRTPQEAGALAAVIALIEEARHARFEEAVRTENVSSRLRQGVIAEVGAGRPATVGRESIRLPDTCEIKPKTLQCE